MDGYVKDGSKNGWVKGIIKNDGWIDGETNG